MQDRYLQLDEILLRRTAGPYIRAISCREHVQQIMVYSITSSALARRVGGTERKRLRERRRRKPFVRSATGHADLRQGMSIDTRRR